MDNLGFGMVDRRTVAAVLFALGTAAALGLEVPVDVNDIGRLFVSIVLLTGYIYAARTASRVPVVGYVFFKQKHPIRMLLHASFVYEYGNGIDARWRGFSGRPLHIIKMIDRLIVVVSVLAACVPTLRGFVRICGIAGIISMLANYVLLGGFSFLVRDAIDCARREKY